LKPGDVVVGTLPGALETKVRPAVVIASGTYLVERPDVLLGILSEYCKEVAVFHPHNDKRDEWKNNCVSVFNVDPEDLENSRLDLITPPFMHLPPGSLSLVG
jgi:hypothetical protein